MATSNSDAKALQPKITAIDGPDSPPQQPSRSYPEWFNRIRTISYLDAQDYDEDISEIGADEEMDEPECSCDDDEECHCLDDEQEYFYQCRDDRERRKIDLVELRKERAIYMEEVKARELEVENAYRLFLGNQEGVPLTTILGGDFTLYSSQYLDTLPLGADDGGRARVYFYPFVDKLHGMDARKQGRMGDRTVICGSVYFTSEATCDFGPFTMPKVASVRVCEPKSEEGHLLHFQFFSEQYLKMWVSRNLFLGEESTPTSKGMVECFGILRDAEKEKRERREKEEERRLAFVS